MDIPAFQRKILGWYNRNKRDLPWRPPTLKLRRGKPDPYKILVSEIMLQQTQVSRVIPKYKEFLKAFPTMDALAKAPNKKLLKVWAGLGYWKRALNLKETAGILCKYRKSNRSDLPRLQAGRSCWSDPTFLETLPGIGHYTARALACSAFGNNEAFLDTNIRRVYLHFFFPKRKNISDKEILKIARKAVWEKNPREWHYALFDYGAIVLKDKKINKQSKHYIKQSRFEGSFRSFRTKVVKFLLKQKDGKAPRKTIEAFLKDSPYPPKKIIDSLAKDGLITKRDLWVSLN